MFVFPIVEIFTLFRNYLENTCMQDNSSRIWKELKNISKSRATQSIYEKDTDYKNRLLLYFLNLSKIFFTHIQKWSLI